MSFFVIGVNHKACPVEFREMLHFSPEALAEALLRLREYPEIQEAVVLSTCNRVEFYGYSEKSGIPEPLVLDWIESVKEIDTALFSSYLYRLEGRDAMRHLFRVASGLDSLVIGENEILGQLREAFRAANDAGSVKTYLYRLMEKALKAGKDVRTKTKINEGVISIPSVAVELAEKIFSHLSGKKIMVLGTGEMGSLTLKSLKAAGGEAFYIVSRDPERGRKIAREFGSEWLAFESWEPYLSEVDILIASTSSLEPVVNFEQVKRVMDNRPNRPLFLIDIAVPRDIDPRTNSLDNVYLYNIDDLKNVTASNLKLRHREIQAAETMVENAVVDFQAWMENLKARPTLENFEQFLDDVLEQELARFSRETGFEEPKREELRQRIRAKLMHPTLEKVKQASQNGGAARYLEALQSLFGLDEKK
ncbi:MAG TPA: glutamyl-tRNA reductase [bacterium]|nr:glutamyl-tRNA reductase [bacterium]